MTITLGELKTHLGMSGAAGDHETILQRAVDAANAAVADYTGRTFVVIDDDTTADTRIFRSTGAVTLIDDVIDVTLVESSSDATTWTTIGASSWWMEPFNTNPKYRLYSTVCAPFLRVTGKWGFGSIPAAATQAGLIIAARLAKRKDSVDGIAYGGDLGVFRVSRYEDPDAARLLDPLRRVDKTIGIA